MTRRIRRSSQDIINKRVGWPSMVARHVRGMAQLQRGLNTDLSLCLSKFKSKDTVSILDEYLPRIRSNAIAINTLALGVVNSRETSRGKPPTWYLAADEIVIESRQIIDTAEYIPSFIRADEWISVGDYLKAATEAAEYIGILLKEAPKQKTDEYPIVKDIKELLKKLPEYED